MENKFMGLALPDTFTNAQSLELQGKIWKILARQAELYSAGDSSSLPENIARELAASVMFTLRMGMEESGLNDPAALLVTDADSLVTAGRARIKTLTARSKRLWSAVCVTAPPVESVSYNDTIREIGRFFKNYDALFFAHQIPCDIDYQLCRPVSEELEGVEYICEYLSRVLTENAVMRAFDSAAVTAVLKKASPDYAKLLMNMCSPVLAAAAGLSMAGRDIKGLSLPPEDRKLLLKQLQPLPEDELEGRLSAAAEEICRVAGLKFSEQRQYVQAAVLDIKPRLRAALDAGDITQAL